MTRQSSQEAEDRLSTGRRSCSSYQRLLTTTHATDLSQGNRFITRIFATFATIAVALLVSTPGFAQEQQHHAYSEYTYWFDGSLGNGHAFSSTVDGRNYQLESRYERLIYWKEPFAVRWVFDAIPVAFVGDPHTSNGHRAYAYGAGGSPIGAQVNFVHFRRFEPFLTSGGGFLYFNHRMFGTTQQFNFTAQLGGGVQIFTPSHRSALDIGYKYHHISNANLANQNPGMDSHMLFIGVSLFR